MGILSATWIGRARRVPRLSVYSTPTSTQAPAAGYDPSAEEIEGARLLPGPVPPRAAPDPPLGPHAEAARPGIRGVGRPRRAGLRSRSERSGRRAGRPLPAGARTHPARLSLDARSLSAGNPTPARAGGRVRLAGLPLGPGLSDPAAGALRGDARRRRQRRLHPFLAGA